MLADLQEKEKALATELKNLKLELQNERGFYKVEMKEKKILAQKYKEDLNKAETESLIRNTYQKKEFETSEKCQQRILKEKEEDLLREKKRVLLSLDREKRVFQKTKEYLEREIDSLKERVRTKRREVEQNKEKIEKEIEDLRQANQAEQKRIDELEELYNEEKTRLQKEKREIKQYFDMKKIKEAEDRKKDTAMKFIQKQFEEWFEKVGRFRRKKKRKKKSK